MSERDKDLGERRRVWDSRKCEHCGCRFEYHEVGCPALVDDIVEKVTSGFADDVRRILGDEPPEVAGGMTHQQQCQMIAEASAWRARALKAEALLATQQKATPNA